MPLNTPWFPAMQKTTSILLWICPIGIISNLGWMIFKDRASDAAQRQTQERLRNEELAAERLRIWNVATSERFQYDLKRWLNKRYGETIILDAIYVREYRNGDVNYPGGREAVVSGVATFAMRRHEDTFFYADWRSKMTVSDSGEWRGSPSFSLSGGKLDGPEWGDTAKVIMPPQRIEKLRWGAARLLSH